jgi:DnaJ like chaperone protein
VYTRSAQCSRASLQGTAEPICSGRGSAEMIWQGKAFGALLGIAVAGPVGAIFGAFIGHLVDAQLEGQARGPVGSPTIQETFFRATFQAMGHMAKADGRVSEEEIRAARAMMTELRLGTAEVQRAIELFTQGKARDFPLMATLRELHAACHDRPDLRRMFVQIQLQAALWGGSLNSAGRDVLKRIAVALEVSGFELVQMEALLRMQNTRRSEAPQAEIDRHRRLEQAYAVLGVERSASDAEITKAYRRLMNQNHPDKLLAKGLPESMLKLAQDKTAQIRAAYEVLRESRGIK